MQKNRQPKKQKPFFHEDMVELSNLNISPNKVGHFDSTAGIKSVPKSNFEETFKSTDKLIGQQQSETEVDEDAIAIYSLYKTARFSCSQALL